MRKACHAQEDDGGGGTIDGADNDNGNGQMEKGAKASASKAFILSRLNPPFSTPDFICAPSE